MPIKCGGDWNLVLENKDKKGAPCCHIRKIERLKHFIERNDS